MSRARGVTVLLVLAVAGAAAVAAFVELRRRHELATAATDDIEDTLASLDPVTRAAVVARVSADVAGSARKQ